MNPRHFSPAGGRSAALLAGTLLLAGAHQRHGRLGRHARGPRVRDRRDDTFSSPRASGYVATPDGNSIYMWSYGMSGGAFQLPGPTLCVTSGRARSP